jgi:hypothetical protein
MNTDLKKLTEKISDNVGTLLLGTGRAFASMNLVPAFATHLGLGTRSTGTA